MSSSSNEKIIYSFFENDTRGNKLYYTTNESLRKEYPLTFGVSKSAIKNLKKGIEVELYNKEKILSSDNIKILQEDAPLKDTKSKVIIIGNSPSILNKERGDLIESFDIIIRINKCATKGFEKYIGNRTDIWATTYFKYHKDPNNIEKPFLPFYFYGPLIIHHI